MRVRLSVSFGLSTSVLLSGALATASWAQTAPSGASTASSDSLQEIQVTAQRRSQSIMDVPLSITAQSGEQLQNAGIQDITDLELITPGMNVSDSSGYTQVYIRGVGNSIFVGADPSVATFVDDVPRIYGSMVNNFVDTERVEILKGAQGGLYGRNATGGVVNILTYQPSLTDFKADARLEYGEHETFEAATYVNLPVNDEIAVSLAGERIKHNPYISSGAPNDPYTAANFPGGSAVGNAAQTAAFFNSGVDSHGTADADFYAFDGKILVKPTDNFKVTFAGDFSNKNDSGGNQLMQVSPAITQGVLEGFLGAYAGANPDLPPGFLKGNLPKFTSSINSPGFVDLKDFGGSATAVLNLPGVDLTAISAYRGQHTDFLTDLGAASVPLFGANVDNVKHYEYQELRGVSTWSGPFHLIGGATILTSHYEGRTDLNILAPLVTDVPTAYAIDKVKNYSAYVQPEYDITNDLTLTASGRFVHETNTAFFPGTAGIDTETLTQQKWLPSATLSYKLPTGGNVYARYAEGFKAGGVNPVAPADAFTNPATQGGTFKGETVNTYETGVRMPFLDNKIQATAAVFYNDYKNLQTAAHANEAHAAVIEAIINAGSARTYGVEGTVNWRVTSPITVGMTAGYLNAKYKTFANTDPSVLVPFDLSGTRMPNAPELQASVNGNYDQPISGSLRLVANVVVSYTSDILWANSGLPGVLPDATQSAYVITNVRIGIRTTNDRYGVAVFANNLTDTGYTTYGSSAATTGTIVTLGNPRIVGVEGTAKF
jgi:iron complex outermembrane receptor protein